MSELRSKVKSFFARLAATGFFHIFGAGSINKILAALLSIALVRIMTKSDFGAWSYAYNIASFFIVFNGLGATSALLQLGSELAGEKISTSCIASYAIRCGVICDILIAAAIVACGTVIPLAVEGSNQLLVLYCFYPLFTLLYEMKLTVLRVHLRNGEYAFLTNIQTVANFALSVVGALLFGAIGLIVGQQLAMLLAWTLGFVVSRNAPDKGNRLRADTAVGAHDSSLHFDILKKSYWRIALMSAFNNGLSQMLTLVGTFFVGFFLASDALVADYKVATTIPFALLFLPSIVCTYIYPYFARHKDDVRWTLRAYLVTVAASTSGFLLLTLLLVFFSEPLVLLLFGEAYINTVPVLRVLLLGFFLAASFRQVSGNLLVTQRKLGANSAIGVISIVVNVGGSVAIIPVLGMEGAAWVWTITMGIGAVLSTGCYLWTLCKMKSKETLGL